MTTRKLLFGWLFLASASLVLAQTDSNSVTVTASRSDSQQADQAIFAVRVSSPLNITLDDVVADLAGSGITAADLSTVYSSQMFSPDRTQNCGSNLQWTFTLAAPSSRVKDTASLLATLQQQVPHRI